MATTETTKLKEDALQEQPIETQATPVQATQEEINQAQPEDQAPVEEPVDTNIEDTEVPVDDTVNEDPMFTPPAPGYVPAGWVKIEDLASAVAQATGDTEVAEVAPDVQTPAVNPQEETAATVPAQQTVEEPLVQESLENSYEDRMTEADEAEEDLRGKSMQYCLDKALGLGEFAESNKRVREAEEGLLDDIEDDVEESEYEESEYDPEEDEQVKALVGAPEGDEEGVEGEDIDDEEDEEEDDSLYDKVVDKVREDTKEDENLLDALKDYYDNADAYADNPLKDMVDKLIAANFGAEFVPTDTVDVDESAVNEAPINESVSNLRPRFRGGNIKRNVPRARESYEGFLPAGSEHFANEEDLVRSYENTAAARRRAIANFREAMRAKKSENCVREDDEETYREGVARVSNRFREALRSSSSLENMSESNSNSWNVRRFEERAAEKEQLSFKDLLAKGFLG